MITGILLSWKRVENVRRIASGWLSGGLVTEVLIWNNNGNEHLKPLAGTTVINSSEDLGLYTRFAMACLAKNDCILLQDDDIEVPSPSLLALHQAWQAEPDLIHGVFGRRPKADGSYALKAKGNKEVPVVLTRVLLAHRKYALNFFETAEKFSNIQQGGNPAGNGEDILFSYTVRRITGRFNRIHKLSVKELPSPFAINGRDRKGHIQHRSRLLRACESWIKESSI